MGLKPDDIDLSHAFNTKARASSALDPVLPQHAFLYPKEAFSGRRSSLNHDFSHEISSHRHSSARSRAADPELPEIGAILDKYRLEELVGTGGFAVVYRATHLLLHVPVAIKLLRPKVIRRTPGIAELLCEEARFAAKINHPNVVRVQDVTHTTKITYVVMEYIEGSTLSQTIRARGRLAPDQVLKVGLEVVAGLNAGLEVGLTHRDIKPANILLAKSGMTKIVDLGLAQPSAESANSTIGQRYRRMSVVGTPGYMAPEQLTHPERVDFRADIYSLGVTLYQAAVGAPPFPTRDPVRANAMHLKDPIPPPRQIVPDLPLSLSDLLLAMLAKKPADRPVSYEALRQAMQAALTTL